MTRDAEHTTDPTRLAPMRRGRALVSGMHARPCHGLLSGLASPAVAEMAALAGYDFVVLDGEHGPADRLALQDALRAIAAGGAASVLRTAGDAPALIGAALDAGADMVMVPGVHDARQAAAVVSAARYPPAGHRGNGALVARASGYGLDAGGYLAHAADDLALAVMIESRAGAEAAAEIASVDGIDAVVIGAFDLSADLGVPGRFDAPAFVEAIEGIERAVTGAGCIVGTVVYPGTSVGELVARGHRMITLGADTLLLAEGMRRQLEAAREAVQATRSAR